MPRLSSPMAASAARNFDVLKPGTYYINPMMFMVALDDVQIIERGQVAVVVSNVGEEPKQVQAGC